MIELDLSWWTKASKVITTALSSLILFVFLFFIPSNSLFVRRVLLLDGFLEKWRLCQRKMAKS